MKRMSGIVSGLLSLWLGAIGLQAHAQEPQIILPEIPMAEEADPQPKAGVAGFVEVVPVEKKETLPPPKVALDPVPAPTPAMTPAPARQDLGFYVGLGVYFVKPTWDANFAYTRNGQINPQNVGDPTIQLLLTRDFEFNTLIAPRLFFGYENECGFGMRVSWWHFDQRADINFEVPFSGGGVLIISGSGNTPGTTSTFSPVNGFGLNDGEKDVLRFSNRLITDIWDFDVSQKFGDNCWSFTVGAGIRYAFIEQDYDAISTRANQQFPAASGGLINSREVHIRNVLNLVGPDLFIDGKRSVGNFGLGVYGNLRGGYLFGTGRYTQVASSTIVPPTPGFIPQRFDQIDRNRAALPFLEAELGLEWQGRDLGRVQPFLRVGITGQGYFGLGNARSVSGNANTLENFGFFGGTLVGGVSF